MTFRWFLRCFRREESGQDLAEYCLLTALLTLVAAAIFVYASGGVQAIWSGATVSRTAGGATTPSGSTTPTNTSAQR